MSSKLGDDSLYNNIEKRQCKRLESPFVPLSVRFRVKQFKDQEISSPDWEIVVVKNLGAEGMLFEYNQNLELDSLLDVKIDFFKSMPTINCIGRVLRIEEFQHNSMSSITVKFTEINEQEQGMINTNVENILRKETNGKDFNLEMLELEQAKDAELEKTMLELEQAKDAESEKTRLPFFLKIFSSGRNFNLEKQKKMKDMLIRGRLIIAEKRVELVQARDAELKKIRLELEQAKNAERLYIQR